MFRTTTKLRNWFSFGVDRNPLLFSAAAVFLSTLFYVCVWSYVNVSKPDPLSIFTLECVLVINLIFFVFMYYKHSLINWSVSESGVARDNWTTDQNGNGIAEGISDTGEPSLYLILNGYLEFYKKEDIEISAPIKTFLSHTYRNILVTNPNGTIKNTKIRCDDDLLNSVLKKIMNQNASEEDATGLSKHNSDPSLDDESSKSDSNIIQDTDTISSETSAGSSNSASQLPIQKFPNEASVEKTELASEGPQKQNANEPNDKTDLKSEVDDFLNDEQRATQACEGSKLFPKEKFDEIELMVVNMLLEAGAKIVLKIEGKNIGRKHEHINLRMAIDAVVRKLDSNNIRLCQSDFRKILKKTFYPEFERTAINHQLLYTLCTREEKRKRSK